jgi:hypothetical protein
MRNIHALGSLRVFWAMMSAGIDKSRRVQNELFLLYHDFSLLLECGHVAKVEIGRGPLKEVSVWRSMNGKGPGYG